ncbi:MAG: histidine kinase [Betaproteobacteria bacterium]|nr:histidine kinase [Betaproteobacteria bacterium]
MPDRREIDWSALEASRTAQFVLRAGRLVFVNATMATLFGYDRDNLLGKPLVELARADDRPRLEEALSRAGRGLLCEPVEVTGERADRTALTIVIGCEAMGGLGGVLLVGFVIDVGARSAREDELARSQDMLRVLAAHHERVREAERKRIAREIHDELGQRLSSLKIGVAALVSPVPESPGLLPGMVQPILAAIDGIIDTVRNIAAELRPAVLDLGLVAACEWQIQALAQSTGIRVHAALPPREPALDEACATAVFRILQESLTNVARHSHATEVGVVLRVDGEGTLLLQVDDNGVGLNPDAVDREASLGLLGMRERALMFGGTLAMGPSRLGGACVRLLIPLGRAEKAGLQPDSDSAKP